MTAPITKRASGTQLAAVRTRESLGGTNNNQHEYSRRASEHEETEETQEKQLGLTDAKYGDHGAPGLDELRQHVERLSGLLHRTQLAHQLLRSQDRRIR
jgi:alpha-mannosidase